MVRLAFVGCGTIMEEHYRHLGTMPDTNLVGHCDLERERAESAAQRFGGSAFTSAATMFEKTKPHAVYIAVPPHAHGNIETEAAERGLHMFIEKPVAIHTRLGKDIAAAIRKNKVLASVGYCYRYYDTITLARRMLKGKAISLVYGYWNAGMQQTPWWRRMDRSGGQIVEQSTHLFDLMRYLCGDVAEVYAVSSRGCMTKVKDYDIDDSSVVSLRLKNGASACITSTCMATNGGRVGLEIFTPEATLRFDGGVLRVTEEDKTTEYRPGVNVYEEESRAFIEAVQAGKRSRIRSTYADALKTLMVTCAANESTQSGMPVKP